MKGTVFTVVLLAAAFCFTAVAQSPLAGDHPIQKIQDQLLQADLNCSQDWGAYAKRLQQTYAAQLQQHRSELAIQAMALGKPVPADSFKPTVVPDPVIVKPMYERRMKVYTAVLPQIVKLRKGVLAMADGLTAAQLAQDRAEFAAAQAAATAPDVVPATLEGKEAGFKFQLMHQYLSDLQSEKIGTHGETVGAHAPGK